MNYLHAKMLLPNQTTCQLKLFGANLPESQWGRCSQEGVAVTSRGKQPAMRKAKNLLEPPTPQLSFRLFFVDSFDVGPQPFCRWAAGG